MAAPWSHRFLPNSRIYPFRTHAEQRGIRDSEPAHDSLIPDKGSVCLGIPEYAKGITANPSPMHPDPSERRPVFEKDRRKAVLGLIHYPWEDLGFNIVFRGSRPGYRAMTLTTRHRIEIYARPGEGPMQQAYDLAHELGHAFDLKYNTEERRLRWRELRGIKASTPWFGCNACPDYGTPAGDFAETFAFLLLGPGNFHSLMAPLPTTDRIPELAAFCQIEHLSESLSAWLSKENRAAKIAQEERLLGMENSPEEELVDYPDPRGIKAPPDESVTAVTR